MKTGMRREERRLRRIFERSLLLALATPAAIPFACSSPKTASVGSGPLDSSATGDGPHGDGGHEDGDTGGGMDVGADTSLWDAKCAPIPFEPDPPDDCGAY